jgi:hypothetical protein
MIWKYVYVYNFEISIVHYKKWFKVRNYDFIMICVDMIMPDPFPAPGFPGRRKVQPWESGFYLDKLKYKEKH